MRISNQSNRSYAVHFKSLFSIELNWQLGLIALVMLFVSAVQGSAQFFPQVGEPQPMQQFAVTQAKQEAFAAYTVAVANHEAMVSAQAAVAAAKAAYEAVITEMVTAGIEADVPSDAFPKMEAYVDAQIVFGATVAAHEASLAKYQHLAAVFSQYSGAMTSELEAEVARLRTEVDLLSGIDQEVAQLGTLLGRVEILENEYTELANTVNNWCAANRSTTLCQALDLPE